MKKITTVEDYIAQAPTAAQPMLKEIRAAIKSVAPKAEEKISYAMPYFGYKGRLVYYSAFTKHIGVYAMGPAMKAYPKEILPYRTSKSTLQFPIGTKVPIPLIKKLVRAQMKANEAAFALKAKKA